MASLQVKEFPAHTAAVNDLSFDIEGEYIGSCSDDGSVVINSLFTDEKMRFEYHRPMKAIALDPDYAKKSSRRFAAGGLAGHLYYNTKRWLGFRDQVCTKLILLHVKKNFPSMLSNFLKQICPSRFCILVKVLYMQ